RNARTGGAHGDAATVGRRGARRAVGQRRTATADAARAGLGAVARVAVLARRSVGLAGARPARRQAGGTDERIREARAREARVVDAPERTAPRQENRGPLDAEHEAVLRERIAVPLLARDVEHLLAERVRTLRDRRQRGE